MRRRRTIAPSAKTRRDSEEGLNEGTRHEPHTRPRSDLVAQPSAESTEQEAKQRREGLGITGTEVIVTVPRPLFSGDRVPRCLLGDGGGLQNERVGVLAEELGDGHRALNGITGLERRPDIGGGVGDGVGLKQVRHARCEQAVGGIAYHWTHVSGHEAVCTKGEARNVGIDLRH